MVPGSVREGTGRRHGPARSVDGLVSVPRREPVRHRRVLPVGEPGRELAGHPGQHPGLPRGRGSLGQIEQGRKRNGADRFSLVCRVLLRLSLADHDRGQAESSPCIGHLQIEPPRRLDSCRMADCPRLVMFANGARNSSSRTRFPRDCRRVMEERCAKRGTRCTSFWDLVTRCLSPFARQAARRPRPSAACFRFGLILRRGIDLDFAVS
jgi:hypothetical protein